MAAALAVAAFVLLGLLAAQSGTAFAADDDGSATTTADIVLVTPGGSGSGGTGGDTPGSGDGDSTGGGSGGGSSENGSSGSGASGSAHSSDRTRGASPLTGDRLSPLSFLALAVAAAVVAVFSRRRALAAAAATRPGTRTKSAVHARTGIRAQAPTAWKRVTAAAAIVFALALALSAAFTLSARATGNDVIRIEMQQSGDGSWTGTATYYVNNDATYYRDIAKVTEAAASGFDFTDGSLTVTVAPAVSPDDAIASTEAVNGAPTSGSASWRIKGSAVSDDHALALKVTAKAKELEPGDNEVGTATFDMTAPAYEGLGVRLSTSPAVGKLLAATPSGEPAEASNALTYTWLVSDDGESWASVPGATDSAYTPTPDMAGKKVSVRVACANSAWFAVTPGSYTAAAAIADAPAAGAGQAGSAHTVIFDVGGHGDAPAAQVVDDGTCAERPATDPSATGYVFGGWYADADCTQPFAFTTPITEDTTVYASWVADNVGAYTVVHMLQNIDDDGYSEGAREVRVGESTGELADLKGDFPGFSVNEQLSPEGAQEGDAHVLRVYYDRRTYTVTFHANGGIFAKRENVRFGATVSEPDSAPTAEGKDFKGWSTVAGATQAYDFGKPVTGDLDLHAILKTQSFTVTFQTWGQQPTPAVQTVDYGDKATVPGQPQVDDGPAGGPAFKGWYKDAELTEAFDFDRPITENTTVYASYSPNVMFVLGGDMGESVVFPVKLGANMAIDAKDPTATKVASGTDEKTVSAPGYKIVSWHEKEDLSDQAVTALANITENKVLYPKIQPTTYKVVFDKNHADATGTMDDQEFTYGVEQALTAKAFTRPGYTFAGWNTVADGSGTGYSDGQNVKDLATGMEGDDSVTLFAQWSPATDTPYKVEHYKQNAAGDGYDKVDADTEDLTGTTGAEVTATAKAYTGYVHNADADDAEESGVIAADGSLVLKVYYDRQKLTVTFNANGHGTDPAPADNVPYSATVEAPDEPTADGYTLVGWFTEPGCKIQWKFDEDVVTEDITLYAKWEGKSFDITFAKNADDATGDMDAMTNVRIGEPVTLADNAFERAGFKFAGWNTVANPTAEEPGAFFADKANVAAASVSPTGENVTLYAQWEGLPTTYTVRHYKQTAARGSDYDLADTEEHVPGVAGEMTDAVAKAYENFDCAGTDKAGNGEIVQEKIQPGGATAINIYYNITSHTVTFHAWGQADVDPQTVVHGGTASDPHIASETGKPAFEGWFASDTFSGSAYDFDTPVTADLDLYAKYKVNVLVDFQAAAENVSFPKVLGTDFEASELSDVHADGYTIEGWYKDGDCSEPWAFPISMDDYKVIYPKLVPDTDTRYTVEHYLQSLTDDDAYEVDDSLTETLYGTTGETATASAKSIDGFTHDGDNVRAVESGVIAGDGSLVLKVYYTRDKDTPYTVKHWLQNADGSYPDLATANPADVDSDLKGKTGAQTAASAKTYEHYNAQPFSQVAIQGDGSTVVNIMYALDTYTVSFVANGHGSAPAAQTVRYGATADEPAALTDTGYDFGGWYTTNSPFYEANRYDFDTAVTENKVLYAKWTAKLFDVIFDVRSAMANQPDKQSVEYGAKVNDPGDPALPGYTFLGWFKDYTYETPFQFATEVVKKAITIYGKTTPNKYNIAFDKNAAYATGATEGIENIPYDEEDVELTANGFKRPGYTFIGWNTKAAPTEQEPGTPYEDKATVQKLATADGATVTLYAQWKANADTPYKVEHYLPNEQGDGYVLADTEDLSGTTDTWVDAQPKEYDGYEHDADAQGAVEGGLIAGNGSLVLKVYYDVPEGFTVTFDANGHGTAPPPVKYVQSGATITAPSDPDDTGYVFGGWYRESGCTTAWNFETDTVTDDMTLYAKWEGKPFTVSFDANGSGATGSTASVSGKVGATVTLTSNGFKRTGYDFANWNTKPDGTGKSYGNGDSRADLSSDGTDVVLYAQWSPATQVNYTVKHMKESGLGTGEFTVEDSTETLKDCAGMKTLAVAKDIEGYEAQPFDQAEITNDGNTVVTINYKVRACKVTFKTWNQGTVNPQTVAYGTTATMPVSPVVDAGNPTFKGWYADATFSESSAYDFSTPVKSDITLYAKYTPDIRIDFQGAAENISIPTTMNSSFEASGLDGITVAGYDIVDAKWYVDSAFNTPWTFPIQMDGDKVIYAKLQAKPVKYTVEHYWQSVSNTSVYELYESESLEGTPGENTAAANKGYPGVTAKGTAKNGNGAITQKKIANDGSTVVQLYYTRNTNTAYKVEHYQQTVDGSDYTLAATDNKTGKTGATTAAAKRSYTGFTNKPFTQAAISGDGQTVVKIFYDRNAFTVTFNNGGHGVAPAAQTVLYGGTATQPEDPSEAGWHFDGWRTASNGSTAFNFASTITKNTTVYAKWTQYVTVTFNDNGGSNGPGTQQFVKGVAGTLSDVVPTRESTIVDPGYTVSFNGWLSNASTTFNGLKVEMQKGYKIEGLPEATTVPYEDAWVFDKWATKQTGTTNVTYYSPGQANLKFTGNATVYARWTEQKRATEGTIITLPEPPELAEQLQDFFTFQGWYSTKPPVTNASFSDTWKQQNFVGDPGDTYVPAGDVTLWAYWTLRTDANYVKLVTGKTPSSTGDTYTGSGETSLLWYANGDKEVEIPECTLTPDVEGTAFIGWNSAEDGSGKWYFPGDKVTADYLGRGNGVYNSGIHYEGYLYAQWSHLGGKTAAEIHANTSAYSSYIGDLWVSDRFESAGAGASIANDADEHLLCRLVDANNEQDGTLTFVAARIFPVKSVTVSADQHKLGWGSDGHPIKNMMNSEDGSIYSCLPASLKDNAVSVTKSYTSLVDGEYANREWTGKFWIPSIKELGIAATAGDFTPIQDYINLYSASSDKTYAYFVNTSLTEKAKGLGSNVSNSQTKYGGVNDTYGAIIMRDLMKEKAASRWCSYRITRDGNKYTVYNTIGEQTSTAYVICFCL